MWYWWVLIYIVGWFLFQVTLSALDFETAIKEEKVMLGVVWPLSVAVIPIILLGFFMYEFGGYVGGLISDKIHGRK